MARGADHRAPGRRSRAAPQREAGRPRGHLMAKKKARVRLIDTTFRDAQQSLLGGYLRTDEIVPIAAKMDSIGFAAMEAFGGATFETQLDRKSTRLNSSHITNSYAVFCLKKKKKHYAKSLTEWQQRYFLSHSPQR